MHMSDWQLVTFNNCLCSIKTTVVKLNTGFQANKYSVISRSRNMSKLLAIDYKNYLSPE